MKRRNKTMQIFALIAIIFAAVFAGVAALIAYNNSRISRSKIERIIREIEREQEDNNA